VRFNDEEEPGPPLTRRRGPRRARTGTVEAEVVEMVGKRVRVRTAGEERVLAVRTRVGTMSA
jgi:hypothetical protein